MRKDVNCPYCGVGQEIDHDDSYGYEEDKLYEQQCPNCDKYFTYTTGIIYVYNTYKAGCLNGMPHKFEPTTTYPKEFTMMKCTTCNERRKPTDEEMKAILAT